MVSLPIAAWWAALGAHGWASRSPRYVALHRGSLVFLSSIYDHPPRDPRGRPEPWTYDVIGMRVENGRGPWPRGAFRQMTASTPGPSWWPPIRQIGSRYSLGASRWSRPMWMLELPLWALSLPAVPAAALAWRGLRRSRRSHAGACSRCGYDLGGLGPGVACPECGPPQPP